MDEEYLRNIQNWLRTEFPGKVVDVPWETEISPVIPQQRTPVD